MIDFKTIVLGATGSVEDWARTLRTPAPDLPALTAEEKEDAHRRGISDEDYARRLLLERLADGRWRERGERLGEIVKEVMKPLEAEYPLKTVLAEVSKGRWTVRFVGPHGIEDVHLDGQLVDDLINFDAPEDAENLRVRILTSLGRAEFVQG